MMKTLTALCMFLIPFTGCYPTETDGPCPEGQRDLYPKIERTYCIPGTAK